MSSKASSLVWQIACPPQFASRADMADLQEFIQLLQKRLVEKGHTPLLFPFTRVPWSRKGITLNFHTTGYEPNSYHYKESFLKDWVQIDRLGHTGWHSNNLGLSFKVEGETQQKRDAGLPARVDAYIKSRASKYVQDGAQSADALGEAYVFFPLQKGQDDTTAFARFDLSEAISQVTEACAARGLRLVLKAHPLCHSARVKKIIAEKAKHPAVVVSEGNVVDLIEAAKAIVTVNSSVGFEALLRDRPIITLGQAEYTPSSIAVRDLEKIGAALDQALSHQPDGICRQAALDFVSNSLFEKNSPEDIDCLIDYLTAHYERMFGRQNHGLPVFDGKKIEFHEMGKGAAHMLHGFSYPEEWGAWSNDEFCAVAFTAEPNLAGKKRNLVFKVRPYTKEMWPVITFNVYVNGKMIRHRHRVTIEHGMGDVFVDVPVQFEAGTNVVCFRVLESVRPINLQTDFDVRKMGIGLIAMEIRRPFIGIFKNIGNGSVRILRDLKKTMKQIITMDFIAHLTGWFL